MIIGQIEEKVYTLIANCNSPDLLELLRQIGKRCLWTQRLLDAYLRECYDCYTIYGKV